MIQYVIKIALTSLLVVAVSEASKRNVVVGALLASLPLTSVLAMGWLYADTRDTEQVAQLATGIFWLVLPSLVLFIALPLLLRRGVAFVPSLGLSIAMTIAAYFAMLEILKRFGISL